MKETAVLPSALSFGESPALLLAGFPGPRGLLSATFLIAFLVLSPLTPLRGRKGQVSLTVGLGLLIVNLWAFVP